MNAVPQAARGHQLSSHHQVFQWRSSILGWQGYQEHHEKAAILGSIAGAKHVRLMAKHYGVPVVLHSDHCAKKLLPWFDGMLGGQ